eukprot:XP_011422189.1 PREDICTED: uncharacterized protein LOC105324727 [Crassostrea gigas]
MGINIAVKKGRWNTYFSRSRSDISVSREGIQEPEEEGHRVPVKAELPASDPPVSDPPKLSGHQLDVVDCHCHHGRMPAPFTGAMNAAALDSRPALVPVTISGGCLVYGMEEARIPMRLESGLVIAKGIHLKEAYRATRADVAATMSMCNSKGWAVGEIDLDYSTKEHHPQQKFILAEFFRRVDPSSNMVLHLRGADEDSCSRVPTQDCITLSDGLGVSIQAPIYLHCFLGGPAQIKLWIDTGRPVFFGVSGRVRSMLDTQQEGVRAIPQDRIMVETDSPYLTCGVGRPMTPKHIGKVYQLVATLRGESAVHLAEAVTRNFCTFFAKQLGQKR